MTYQPSEIREVWSGPRLIVSSLEWFEEERRERSANNSFLLLNFLSGERGQVTGRETETEEGEAALRATLKQRTEEWMEASLQRGKGGLRAVLPIVCSLLLPRPASVKRRV